ncbi:3530_t:CDS:2 [Cetraspora pellucida]|uniref:3530_t:CDS:1 n=1 Tax=Cetraspora pellucida TaxID=1433469 RepID=A0ACA9LH49_9GLOM|nr:3530_t:CDS:2 [Cetraspora pellucida]
MLKSTAKVNINVNSINIPIYLQVLESVDENLLLGTDWFQKALVIVNFDEQKLKFKYKSKNLEEVESYSTDSISVGKVLESKLEERIDNKNVEEESPTVCLAVIEKVSTKKKVPVNEKLLVKDQLVRIINCVNIEV